MPLVVRARLQLGPIMGENAYLNIILDTYEVFFFWFKIRIKNYTSECLSIIDYEN